MGMNLDRGERIKPLAAAMLLGLGVEAPDAQAATQIAVTTAGDAGTNSTCTLRQGIVAMNAAGSTTGTACVASSISGTTDTVVFNTTTFPRNGTNTITLADVANNQLSITDANLAIDASANGNVTVQRPAAAANAFGIIYDASHGALTINGLTISNGKLTVAQPSGAALGAGISCAYTNLTAIDSVVSGNSIATSDYAAGGGIVVYAGNLSLTNSVVSNNTVSGSSGESGMGGGVFVRQNILTQVGGNATITGSQISGNTAKGNGGGLHIGGTLTMSNSSVTNNTAANNGGGMKIYGATTLTNSTISGNSTANNGGGIYDSSGYTGVPLTLLKLQGTTLSGNSVTNGAGSRGGGIFSVYGDLYFINSTIYGNSAPNGFGYGGGVYVRKNNSPITMQQTTVASNTANTRGGGLMIMTSGSGAVVFNGTVFDNTVAPSTGGGNIAVTTGSITIAGSGNLVFSGTSVPGNVINVSFANAPIDGDPILGTLVNNGGPTQTLLPSAGSAAINAIPETSGQCPVPIDQRGLIRPDPTSANLPTPCDIGAVEVNSIPDEIFANGFEPGATRAQTPQ
jgi:hypothetical protein